jgi:ArsR family transcriptional regulator, arsenate/arsenite/antimonite-responsive transcriptional repressor
MNQVYEALAHPTRRRVLALLRAGDLTAGELAEHVAIPKPTLSGHLRVLREAGLVQGDRHGTSITYHLNASLLEEAMAALLELLGIHPHGEGRERHGATRRTASGQTADPGDAAPGALGERTRPDRDGGADGLGLAQGPG